MTEVQLFSTCLAEEFFPEVNDAAATVLERLRLKVTPIRGAFCCGQVAFNEGMREQAVALARRFLNSVQPGIPIVVPSGSCTSMLKIFYGDLLADDPPLAARAAAIRPWVFELSQFIVNVLKVKYLGARYERAVAYHPSCHLMRELGVRAEPMTLLPPASLVIVQIDRMMPNLAAILAEIGPAGVAANRLTLITGPSRTADIEKRIVLGVHGPKSLHVIVVWPRDD